MTFHVRITVSDVPSGTKSFPIAIGETVLVKENGEV